MNIILPQRLKNDVEFFETAFVRAYKNDVLLLEAELFKPHIRACKVKNLKFLTFPTVIFDKCDRIEFVLKYSSGSVVIPYKDKETVRYDKSKRSIEALSQLRKNNDVIYADNDEDKALIMSIVDALYTQTLTLSNDYLGSKSLIYYTISKDLDYIPVLRASINSLLTHNVKRNFDILLITTEEYRIGLEADAGIMAADPKFLIVDEPIDGVQASMNKLRIFEYPELYNYRNILFLDCDIVCTGSISSLFCKPLKEDELFTVCNPSVGLSAHQSMFHGLNFREEAKEQRILDNTQFPFNAGQFMFKNSTRMKSHFDNVKWLASVWPGKFFFEQSFMNRYFCGFCLTNFQKLKPYFELVSVTTESIENKLHNDETRFIHFIAPALNPVAKLSFLQDYCDAHQLPI